MSGPAAEFDASTGDPLSGRDMLCFSHDWSSDPLSKTHLMRLLARRNRVLWVNSIGYRAPTATRRDLTRAARKAMAALAPIREVEPNLHVLSPLVVPAYGNPAIRAFNRWMLRIQVRGAMNRLGFRNPINWVFNPAASVIAGSLGESLLIYYCVDEYAAFSDVARASLEGMERDLLKRADLVVTSSENLRRAKVRHNPRTVLVRHGVDWTHFRSALDTSAPLPDDIARLPRPIIGYFGLIADDWVDQDLIAHVARRMPDASIVMLGKTTADVARLKQLPNVHLLGHKPYRSLPDYCRGFDLGLIPFPINEATIHANPLKAREYLAAGLPVVSTAIPEVEALGCCRIGHDTEGVVEQIQAALRDPGPSARRSDPMQRESWEARIDEIRLHIGRVLADRCGGERVPERVLRAA